MRSDEASLTARGVALVRSRLERPPWPTGDADADDRLTAALAAGLTWDDTDRHVPRRDEFVSFMRARTRFVDTAVLRALEDDVHQIVVLGAGYDGRALRFRTPGVQFFEVDHPATQADKRRRLDEIGASLDGIVFVTADFTQRDLAAALAAAGHDAQQRSLFVCEGVLRYLPADAFRALLHTAAELAAPASELAATISTREGEASEHEQAREAALAASGEPVLTVPPRLVALEWVAASGWTVVTIDEANRDAAQTRRARLLVRARR